MRGVQLDLVDGGNDTGRRDDALEMRHEEVRDPDAAGQAGVAQFDQLLPGMQVVVLRGCRPVDEVEVDLVEPQAVQALADRVVGARSPSWRSFQSLVVTKSSRRGMPLFATAAPTPSSLP